MNVELLYFEGCPHWREAAERLDAVLAERGLTAERVLVESPEQAEAVGFRGSPSIHIDGRDPFARGDEPTSFSCRFYDTPDGRAGSPSVEQLRAVLSDAGNGS